MLLDLYQLVWQTPSGPAFDPGLWGDILRVKFVPVPKAMPARRQLLPVAVATPLPTAARFRQTRAYYPQKSRQFVPLPVAAAPPVPTRSRTIQTRAGFPQRRPPVLVPLPAQTVYIPIRPGHRLYPTYGIRARYRTLPLPGSPSPPVPTRSRLIQTRAGYPQRRAPMLIPLPAQTFYVPVRAARRLYAAYVIRPRYRTLPTPGSPAQPVPTKARQVQTRQGYPVKRRPELIVLPGVTTYVPVRTPPRVRTMFVFFPRRLSPVALFQSVTINQTVLVGVKRTVR